jgi:hypothetical protein
MNITGHGFRLALLVLLAALVQWTVALRSPLVSPDGLRFLRLARWIDERGLSETIERTGQHPLFPLATVGAEKCLATVAGRQGSPSWQLAGRLAAGGAMVLMVVPLYGIGLMLFCRTTAFLGTALFVLLPETASLGADVLSDSTYLFFFATALWAGLRFLERRQAAWLVLCGIGSGLAYLARPEGLLIALAAALAVFALALNRRERLPWPRAAICAVCLFAGLALFTVPFALSTGAITPKSSLTLTIGANAIWDMPEENAPLPTLFNDGTAAEPAPGRIELPESPGRDFAFEAKEHSNSQRYRGYTAAAADFIQELSRATRVVFLVLALAGVIAFEVRARSVIAGRFAALAIVLFALVLVQFARSSGYIATRHTLTIVVLLVFWSAAGGRSFFVALLAWLERRRRRLDGTLAGAAHVERRAAISFFATAALVCLPASLRPQHLSRMAHAEAGRWLAENSEPDAVVLDTYGWASLRANRRAYGYPEARQAFEDPRLGYVVAVRKEITAPSARAETLRYLLKTAGEPAGEFKGPADKSREDVLVYRWHPERLGKKD